MSEYQWIMTRPPGTFEARQINSAEDVDAFIASLTENELVNDEIVISDLQNLGVTDGKFTLRYHLDSDWGGDPRQDRTNDLGAYLIADKSLAPNIFTESEESFLSRFEPMQP